MRLTITAVFLMMLGAPIIGQPTTSSRERIQDQIGRQNAERFRRTVRQMESDRAMGTDEVGLRAIKTNSLIEKVRNLYREPTEEEMKLLSPHQEDQDILADFLSQKDTGLIKLIRDTGCADRPYVLVVSERCLKYSMPGAGTSFSFRKESYRIPTLADLSIKDGYFLTTRGSLIQGILVNLGDVRIEDVGSRMKGFNYVSAFAPETDPFKAGEASAKLADGVESDGFVYRSSLPIKDKSTYLLRSVAYEGVIQRSVETLVYDESRLDKRKDVLVAFRVVRLDADGNVTIQWKRLFMKNAPKIKI